MHFSYAVVLTIALTIISANAATSKKKRSTCREPAILQDFDVTRILGHWYEYSRHHHDFENGCDCLTSEVVAVDPNTLQVSSCCQMGGVSNATQKCNIGINRARLTNPEKKEASFQYTRTGVSVESHVWIVDTDYDNYLIANGCDHVTDEEEREIFWILSRDKEINEMEVKKIDDVLKAHNFEKNKIIKQRHGVNICTTKRPNKDMEHSSHSHHEHRKD